MIYKRGLGLNIYIVWSHCRHFFFIYLNKINEIVSNRRDVAAEISYHMLDERDKWGGGGPVVAVHLSSY